MEVRNETTGEVGMFPCDNWLDASQGDKKVERQLNRQGEVGSEVTPDTACRYKVRALPPDDRRNPIPETPEKYPPPCRSLGPAVLGKGLV